MKTSRKILGGWIALLVIIFFLSRPLFAVFFILSIVPVITVYNHFKEVEYRQSIIYHVDKKKEAS